MLIFFKFLSQSFSGCSSVNGPWRIKETLKHIIVSSRFYKKKHRILLGPIFLGKTAIYVREILYKTMVLENNRFIGTLFKTPTKVTFRKGSFLPGLGWV